jgi:Tol biopolymer transport system component
MVNKLFRILSFICGLALLLMGVVLSVARWQEPSQWLVYADFNYTDSIELYRIRADGLALQRLTHDPPNAPIMERLPRWSPNGAWIAYAANDLNYHRIYRMNVNKLKPELVTEGDGYIHALAWSADGRVLIYQINDLGNRQHLRVSVAGGEPRLTTEKLPPDSPPSTSPDGQWIVFTEYQMPQRTLGLYTARPDSENPILLNDRLAADTAYSWSPRIDMAWHGWAVMSLGMCLIGFSFWRVAGNNVRQRAFLRIKT